MIRHQLDKVNDELTQTKLDYDTETMKCIQLTEKKTSLEMELNKTKLKLQYAEEQLDKEGVSNK